MSENHVKNLIESPLPEHQRLAVIASVMTQYFAHLGDDHFREVMANMRSAEAKISGEKPIASFEALVDDKRKLVMCLFRQREIVNQLIDEKVIVPPSPENAV